MDDLRWYVIEAEMGCDFAAYAMLAQTMPDAWRPLDETRISIRRDAPRNMMRAMRKYPRFGRYFFVQCAMNPAVENGILATVDRSKRPLVRSILRSRRDDPPSPIPNEQIDFLRKNKPCRPQNMPKIKIGAVIEATDGPFKGQLGSVVSVDQLDERGILRVDMNIFGRLTPIIFEVGHVALRELGQRPPKQAA